MFISSTRPESLFFRGYSGNLPAMFICYMQRKVKKNSLVTSNSLKQNKIIIVFNVYYEIIAMDN